jgi:hypothetical protein
VNRIDQVDTSVVRFPRSFAFLGRSLSSVVRFSRTPPT